MDNLIETTAPEPKYTKMWIGLHIVYIFSIAGVLALLTMGITSLAKSRLDDGLLPEDRFLLVADSTVYCFMLVVLTLMSLTLVELAFRRSVNIVQYILIGCALCVFYLLLLSMAEHMPFWGAYAIVSAMTVALISLFIRAINRADRPAVITAILLAAEYGLLFMMVCLGSMVLLVGSLLLFAIIALAMYFTLKLRIENEEIFLK